MVKKITSLKELPYKSFHGYTLKTEDDTKFIGDSKAYLFISESPRCIFLFVELDIDKAI